MKWCISIVISRIFNISKLSNSMQWFKKKKYVSGLLWGALSGEESNYDSLMVYVNCCFRIFENINQYWILKIWLHFIWLLNLVTLANSEITPQVVYSSLYPSMQSEQTKSKDEIDGCRLFVDNLTTKLQLLTTQLPHLADGSWDDTHPLCLNKL